MLKTSGDGLREGGGRRIAIAAASGSELVQYDMPLIKALIAKDHDVLCLSPEFTEIEWHTLLAHGAAVEQLDLVAERFALMPNRQVAGRVTKILKTFGADTVLARGRELLPAVVQGAHKAKVPRILPVIDWLVGKAEDLDDAAPELDDELVDEPSRLARVFRHARAFLCYNHDHAAQLEYSGLLLEGSSTVVIPGLGVDLDEFALSDLPPIRQGLTFLMIGELSQSSGVLDFCKAARIVHAHSPGAEFVVAGRASFAPDAVALRTLAEFRGVVEYVGDGSDPASLIDKAHVFVCPARGVGLAYDALPALAKGRPVVVSDAPGCRELVDERVNGCMAKAGDPQSLAQAMESYLRRPDLIPSMARASRLKAERRFDRRLAMAAMLELLAPDPATAGRSHAGPASAQRTTQQRTGT